MTGNRDVVQHALNILGPFKERSTSGLLSFDNIISSILGEENCFPLIPKRHHHRLHKSLGTLL
jgi:hypothetical protein